jgi:5-deoxy-D-glucuronate isomerase
MYVLPWWMQWAQAIALLVISVLGSWIAYKQVTIASAKPDLGLYDKRFAVFEATRKYLVYVLQNSDFSQEAMNGFLLKTVDAVFLFDEEIAAYIDDLDMEVRKFQTLNRQLRNVGDDDAQRAQLADLCAEQMAAMRKELRVLVDKFKPYLKLGNI